MSNFKKISECLEEMKGSFIGTVIDEGELKAGTKKDGTDWTRKNFTIEDDSGSTTLVAWGDDIKRFKRGGKYEVVSPFWKIYNDKKTVEIGKYGQVTQVGMAPDTSQTTMDTAGSRPAPESTTNNAESRPVNGEALPEMNQNLAALVEGETIQLLQIENIVRETMRKFMPKLGQLNDAKIGMFVWEIYLQTKNTNYKKGSETV